MSLITETVELHGEQFVHNYSDADYTILQNETGIEYAEAYDVLTANYTYTETDHPIDETEDEYATIGRILLGDE